MQQWSNWGLPVPIVPNLMPAFGGIPASTPYFPSFGGLGQPGWCPPTTLQHFGDKGGQSQQGGGKGGKGQGWWQPQKGAGKGKGKGNQKGKGQAPKGKGATGRGGNRAQGDQRPEKREREVRVGDDEEERAVKFRVTFGKEPLSKRFDRMNADDEGTAAVLHAACPRQPVDLGDSEPAGVEEEE